MLAGIVVNNAIVLIDRINQLREAGMQRHAAITEAAKQRLRPIIMTTLTTVLGLMPLALGLGEGAEVRAADGNYSHWWLECFNLADARCGASDLYPG